jgi:hypothetical protein
MKKILFLLLTCIICFLPISVLAHDRFENKHGSDLQRGEERSQRDFDKRRERGEQKFEEERQNDRLRKLEKRLPDDQFKTFDKKFGE